MIKKQITHKGHQRRMHLPFYDSKVTRNTLADDIETFSTDTARVLNRIS